MSDKTAIITGAANGIGAALAKRLARRNINLTLVDQDVVNLRKLPIELGLDDSNSLIVVADVSREQDVEAYVRQTLDKFGRIDYFANNAGIEGRSALIEDLTVEDIDRVYQVNVRGVFLGLRAILPVMKKQGGGAIVNTASISSCLGLPKRAAYAMSKHAVAGLTKSAANEAAASGVRVNAVLPGSTHTRMMHQIESDLGDAAKFREKFESTIPMQRYAEPNEIAAVIEFLLSDDASFVTSSLYTVDGGEIWQ